MVCRRRKRLRAPRRPPGRSRLWSQPGGSMRACSSEEANSAAGRGRRRGGRGPSRSSPTRRFSRRWSTVPCRRVRGPVPARSRGTWTAARAATGGGAAAGRGMITREVTMPQYSDRFEGARHQPLPPRGSVCYASVTGVGPGGSPFGGFGLFSGGSWTETTTVSSISISSTPAGSEQVGDVQGGTAARRPRWRPQRARG